MIIDPDAIEWDDANLEHATRHGVSADEIEQVLLRRPSVHRNKRGRSGDFIAYGDTEGGRRVAVVFTYYPDRRMVRPIASWEQQR